PRRPGRGDAHQRGRDRSLLPGDARLPGRGLRAPRPPGDRSAGAGPPRRPRPPAGVPRADRVPAPAPSGRDSGRGLDGPHDRPARAVSRPARAAVARETKAIVAAGRYERDGRAVDIAASVAAARRGSHLHLPDDSVLDLAPTQAGAGAVVVTGETTLQAAARLAGHGHPPVAPPN